MTILVPGLQNSGFLTDGLNGNIIFKLLKCKNCQNVNTFHTLIGESLKNYNFAKSD